MKLAEGLFEVAQRDEQLLHRGGGAGRARRPPTARPRRPVSRRVGGQVEQRLRSNAPAARDRRRRPAQPPRRNSPIHCPPTLSEIERHHVGEDARRLAAAQWASRPGRRRPRGAPGRGDKGVGTVFGRPRRRRCGSRWRKRLLTLFLAPSARRFRSFRGRRSAWPGRRPCRPEASLLGRPSWHRRSWRRPGCGPCGDPRGGGFRPSPGSRPSPASGRPSGRGRSPPGAAVPGPWRRCRQPRRRGRASGGCGRPVSGWAGVFGQQDSQRTGRGDGSAAGTGGCAAGRSWPRVGRLAWRPRSPRQTVKWKVLPGPGGFRPRAARPSAPRGCWRWPGPGPSRRTAAWWTGRPG